jgi:uncharacterized protein with FMN-binding domain
MLFSVADDNYPGSGMGGSERLKVVVTAKGGYLKNLKYIFFNTFLVTT